MAPDSRPRILVVDDTAENLDVVKGILADHYRLTMTRDGRTALRIAERIEPDLILLDIMMPEMDGYEVLHQLRTHLWGEEIPVIFITALAGEEYEAGGLGLGAVDYITKPIAPGILHARVATQLALRTARRELQLRNQQLQHEHEIIEEIVLRLRDEPAFDDTHLRIAALSPENISGDVVLAATTPEQVQHVLLGDFTGHGLPAAVGAPMISHIFYDDTRRGIPLEETLETLNRVLLDRFPAHIFMAAAAVSIDRIRGRLQCHNWGQPEILLFREGRIDTIPSDRPPVGIVPGNGAPGSAASCRFIPGARIYLRTDGFHEAPSTKGEAFGETRFRALLGRAAAGEIPLRQVVDEVLEHAGERTRLDDMTLVEITL
ncbi:MAG TPA: fused response regulator/phosphatase [Sedimenticola thiotaurini]|uniref:Fused response regulator/phosphatase n=1 Tax=Sedimenticola thiotaurini TaxID=1543721 RepID=A0A831RK71_9GAMM|nr:fused response regulator/phosphatase [Sedimenticola thiotaurini]